MSEIENILSTTAENWTEGFSGSQDLKTIEITIKRYQETSNESYQEIGRLLLKAKPIVGSYGKWLSWLQNNVDISICKAQRLMKVAKWLDENEAPVPLLDFTKAYLLSRLSKDDLEGFLKNYHLIGDSPEKQVKDMTKRELEAAIRNYLRLKAGKSSSVQVPQQSLAHASVENVFLKRLDRIRKDVLELAGLVEKDSGICGTFSVELRELCETIIQQFSLEELEDR